MTKIINHHPAADIKQHKTPHYSLSIVAAELTEIR